MRSVFSLVAILAATLLISALFTYPLYLLIGEQNELPLHKVLSRLLLLFGLLFSIVFLAFHKILNTASLGFKINAVKKEILIGKGLIIGIVIVFVLEIALLTLGIHGIDPDFDSSFSALIKLLLKAVIAGALVGLIEETIFRGAIFSILMKNLNALWACVISSLFYSAVHFIKIPRFEGDSIDWLSAFTLLPDAFDFLFRTQMLDEFITLFVLGLFFSLLRLKTGNIYYCIGAHAGIVAMVKVVNYFTNHLPNNPYDFLVNEVNHQMGHLATIWLCLLLVFFYLRYKRSIKLKS